MRVTRLIPAVVVLLAVTVLPLPAHANWSLPAPLESAGWFPSGATVAVARNGMTIVAWVSQRDGESWIRYRRIAPSGALGSVQTLDDANISRGGGQIHVALDDDGDALFTWIRSDPNGLIWQVMAQRVYRNGSVGPPLLLSEPTRSSWLPQVAVTPGGGGAVVFDEHVPEEDGLRQVLVRVSFGGVVGRRWSLPVAPPVAPLQATRRGDFVTAGLNAQAQVVAYRLLPNDRLRSRAITTRRSGDATFATTGVGRKGVAYLVYTLVRSGRPAAVWARRWKPGGALSHPQRISPRDQIAGAASAAVDRDGDMVIAWPSSREPGGEPTAYSRLWRRDGSVSRAHRLGSSTGWSGPYYFSWPPLVAVDADGDGVLVWGSRGVSGPDTTWARRINRRGGVGPRFVIFADALPAFAAYTPQGHGRVGVNSNTGLWLRTKP